MKGREKCPSREYFVFGILYLNSVFGHFSHCGIYLLNRKRMLKGF